jgi:hypothetical protein
MSSVSDLSSLKKSLKFAIAYATASPSATRPSPSPSKSSKSSWMNPAAWAVWTQLAITLLMIPASSSVKEAPPAPPKSFQAGSHLGAPLSKAFHLDNVAAFQSSMSIALASSITSYTPDPLRIFNSLNCVCNAMLSISCVIWRISACICLLSSCV